MQQMQNSGTRLRPVEWFAGVLLGFAGAFLDFYSGYQVLLQSQTVNGMGIMEGYTWAGLAWGIGVILLGVVLLVTSIALAQSSRMNRMGDFGVLMTVYGLAMLFVGGSMYFGLATTMAGAFSPGPAMLAVGALMIANGALMRHLAPRDPANRSLAQAKEKLGDSDT
jgi:hypothetical protein